MGTGQSKSKSEGGSASPAKEKSASPKKEKSASPKKSKPAGNESTPVQNGDGAAAAAGTGEGDANVAKRNGTDRKMKKRTSFYETVDATEVLPYLIIG